ncbi:helix-turn-helix transcriptional regulator [Phenylobacterium montanum]|uniref:Helix-turn-helix transcriptional regulator n=1 Tax=Phenylobacterium montanum TaxID=2823693 RepID=A0A975G4F5_9CAUL|nr:helix-turn-helix transcriptional regulator [Caulobacter sp. S6]
MAQTALTPQGCIEARRRLGWSQQDLAHRSGISWRTIINFETGRHRPRHHTSIALVRAFRECGLAFKLSYEAPGEPQVADRPGQGWPQSSWNDTI